MSHISQSISKITAVDAEVLAATLRYVARLQNAEVTSYIKNYSNGNETEWQGKTVLGALIAKDVPRGIGVSVDSSGKMIFIGDEYGYTTGYTRLKTAIEQGYREIAIAMTLAEMGYVVEPLESAQETIALFCAVKG